LLHPQYQRQWKEAKIRPLYLKYQTNLVAPKQRAKYRPTSITPIMCRPMERTVVRSFLYPTFVEYLDPSAVVVSRLTYVTAYQRRGAGWSLRRISSELMPYSDAVSARQTYQTKRAADGVRQPTFNRIRHNPQCPAQPSAASFCHLPARGLEKRCKLPSGVRGGNLAIYKPLLVSIMLILNFKKIF